MSGDELSKALKSKDRASAFNKFIENCIGCISNEETYEEFDEKISDKFCNAVKNVLSLPLVKGSSDAVIIMLRERIEKKHELLLYAYQAAHSILTSEQSLSFGSRQTKRKKCTEDRSSQQNILITNIFALFHGMPMPLKKAEISLEHSTLLSKLRQLQKDEVAKNTSLKAKARNKSMKEGVTKLFMPSTYARAFSDVWLSIFSLDLEKSVLLQLLETLHVDIMPYLPCPLVLFDFLCDAYDEGGLAGLLSLNGLFVLMTQHGLEYPQFYDKLYLTLTPDVCYTRYRCTFFELMGCFLTTPGLSATIVAAFAKRICRLALHAPTPAVFFIISLVKLLLIKHPQVMVLIHKSDPDFDEKSDNEDEDEDEEEEKITSDPYNALEKIPESSLAINSSLWELQGMLSHYNPTISATAKEFCDELKQPLGGSAPLIQARAGRTFAKMFQRELLRDLKGIPTVAYTTPVPFKAPSETSKTSTLNSTFSF